MVTTFTSRNPQASTMLERVHQMIGTTLHNFKVQNMGLDICDGMLASTMFVLRATVHTTTQIYFCQISLWTRFNN